MPSAPAAPAKSAGTTLGAAATPAPPLPMLPVKVAYDFTLQHPRCVFQLLKQQYSRYTPEMVERITGIPKDQFLKAADLFTSVRKDGDMKKVATIMYAVGWTQHTFGTQIIRTAAILQLLLGNIGRAGGGVNALRGHSNIQGATDMGGVFDTLPGYLKVPNPTDVDLAAHAAVWGAMFNAGQTCVSVERVYALEPVYDQFVDAVVRDVQNLKMGAGEGYDFGSLIDDSQVAVTERHVRDAVAAGAKALTGGKRPDGPGSFYPPTVLVDVDHSMTCMTEETFGPTLPIMKVASVEEAVRLSNDSPYGLSASVFSRDIERAKVVAVQLDCGAVNINDVISNLMCTTAPMGGWKTSGIGARFGGAEGLRKFCRQEAVVAPRTNVGAGGNYYNNSPKALRRMNKLMTKLALVTPRRAAK